MITISHNCHWLILWLQMDYHYSFNHCNRNTIPIVVVCFIIIPVLQEKQWSYEF
jgi:hypothetical protein